MKTWDLEDARSRFGELARRALAHHPQRVAIGDREAVVIVDAVDFAALTFARDLVEFIRRAKSSSTALEADAERRLSHEVGLDALDPLEDR